MDLEQLRYFSVLAEYGTMTFAAERLFISQPALSRRIKALERELGVTLFDRKQGSRQLSLTYAGRQFLGHAQALLAQVQHTKQFVDELQRGTAGLLRIAATPIFLRQIVLPALVAFRKSRPAVEIRVIEAGPRMLSMLTDGSIDLAVGVPAGPLDDFQWEPLFSTAIYALVSPTHPLAGQQSLEVQQLASEKLLMLTPSRLTQPSGEFIYSLLHLQNAPLVFAFESTSLETVLVLAEIGLGVAIVPDLCPYRDHELQAIPVLYQGRQVETTGVTAWKSDLSEPAKEFRQHLKEYSIYGTALGYERWSPASASPAAG
jgi:DNA-binding transcriptional LysR family regulator